MILRSKLNTTVFRLIWRITWHSYIYIEHIFGLISNIHLFSRRFHVTMNWRNLVRLLSIVWTLKWNFTTKYCETTITTTKNGTTEFPEYLRRTQRRIQWGWSEPEIFQANRKQLIFLCSCLVSCQAKLKFFVINSVCSWTGSITIHGKLNVNGQRS